MRRICLLGATGSIGQSTLKLVDQHPERFHVEALTANNQVQALIALCLKYRPRYACIANEALYQPLRDGLAGEGRELAQIQVPLQRLKGIDQWQSWATQLRRIPEVRVLSPSVTGAALASRGSATRGQAAP